MSNLDIENIFENAIRNATEALEKQIPEKVIYESDGDADGHPVYDVAYCPACNYSFEDSFDSWGANYCPRCGKRLNWEF